MQTRTRASSLGIFAWGGYLAGSGGSDGCSLSLCSINMRLDQCRFMDLFFLFRICCCCSSQACTSANSRTASNGWMDGTGRPAINLFLVVADGSADGRSRPYIRNHPSACLVRSLISMLNAFNSRVCCSNAAIWRGIETLEKCATWENPVRLAERAFLSDKPPVTKTQLAPVRRRVQFRHP